MPKNTIGWLVRTETAGHHRYWKVGVANRVLAAEIALDAAGADTAKAVTGFPPDSSLASGLSPGVVTEVVWESRPVTQTFAPSEFEDRVGDNEKALGEITFDIVVPEEGVGFVEGCYRTNDENWHVYFLTNRSNGASSIRAPIIKSQAIFQSGIRGVSGVVPAGWILNKEAIKKTLADAVDVDGWIEVSGPDSLMLK
jgi:hypothetical protein